MIFFYPYSSYPCIPPQCMITNHTLYLLLSYERNMISPICNAPDSRKPKHVIINSETVTLPEACIIRSVCCSSQLTSKTIRNSSGFEFICNLQVFKRSAVQWAIVYDLYLLALISYLIKYKTCLSWLDQCFGLEHPPPHHLLS